MKTPRVLCLLAVLATVALPGAAQSSETETTPAPAAEPQATEQPAVAPEAPPVPAPATVPTTYYEKLTVVVKGKADSNGVIQLRFRPHGGEPKLISVNVLAKMKDKDIASDIWKELSLAAGATYKVKLSGKQIKVKKSNKANPGFALTVLGQSASGVAVSTKR